MIRAYFYVVLIDYVLLSWWLHFAGLTGNPVLTFRVGAIFFIGINAWALLRKSSSSVDQRDGVTISRPSRLATWIIFSVLICAAVIYRVSAIHRSAPINQLNADMLPTIQTAIGDVLQGENPYRGSALRTSDRFLPYLPALWLPYVPAVWLKFDIRYLGLVAVLATGAMLALAPWNTSSGKPRLQPTWEQLALAGCLLLAPNAVWFGAIAGHTHTYWLYLTGLLWSLTRQHWLYAGVWLGLCLSSRQIIITILPILMIYAWKHLPLKAFFSLVGAALLSIFLLLAPFGLQGIQYFVLIFAPAYLQLADSLLDTPQSWFIWHSFGLSSFFYAFGLQKALPFAGIALIVATYILAWVRISSVRSCVRFMALGLFAATVSVGTPMRYEFIPILIFLSVLSLLTNEDS